MVIEIPKDLFWKVAPEDWAGLPREHNYHLDVGAHRGAWFIRMLDGIIGQYVAQPERLADDRELRVIQLEVLNGLTALLLGAAAGPDDSSKAERRAALRRAIEFSRSHCREPCHLDEVAAAAGTNSRTLQRAFDETFNISPIKYLRWCRLNGVHKDLLAADRFTSSVTAIATKWGFTELGRMAGEYRHLFGESPASTLARHRGPPPRDLYSLIHRQAGG